MLTRPRIWLLSKEEILQLMYQLGSN